MLRLGVDYWPATTHAPGVGRYVRELVRALAPRSDEFELKLLDVGPGARSIGEPRLGLEPRSFRRLKAVAPRGALRWAARVGLSADRLVGGCDVFHGAFAGFPPVAAALRTCAVSQLPPPEEHARFAAALARCALVFTFSRAAAALLTERFEIDPARVETLPPGCEHFRRELLGDPPLDEPPRVLVLGRLDERRNPLAVLRACEQLARDGLDLRLEYVGRRGDAYDALRAYVTRSPISSRVRWSSEPNEDELPDALARSSALVHLSDDELTAVTPLEAFAASAAVVATRAPAFVEALGPHGLWIDGPAAEADPAQIAERLAVALAARHDLAARRSRQAIAAAYSWRRHADLALHAWRRIVRERDENRATT